MPDRSPELKAAIRAIGGESDLDAVMPALNDWRLARVIACEPDTDHVVRAVAALHGGLTALLNPATLADPALHAALVRLIGASVGTHVLATWAEAAPAGWGAAHAAALIDAAHSGMCAPGVAAALIGACDSSAALLHNPVNAAVAIRRWGQSDPAAPTAWTTAISPDERDRLIATALSSPFACTFCLPWLPHDTADRSPIVDDVSVGDALTAFADASPTARALHAAILQRLIDHAHPAHLDALTRLACATGAKSVWNRVQTLIRESPDDARRVVAEAPWDDLPKDVRAAILKRAAGSPICAAVAAARGRRDAAMTDITGESAAAFFAALAPAVWDALDAEAQRRWRHALWVGGSHLAVRALGLRPDILARATLTEKLVRAVQRHARGDAATLRQALFPVTLRAVDPDAAHALITAMPTPPRDSGAFFVVASGHDDPDLIAPARAALRTPADLACAIALQRSGDIRSELRARCAALTDALRGRSWDDLAPILPLLSDDVRTVLMPRTAIFARRLARPDRRAALRRTLDRLAALPPEVAIPTHVALHQRTRRRSEASDAADALAHALHAHDGMVLELAEALANDHLRQALLPLPEDAALADALRALAHDDLPTARRLAQAIHTSSWRDALIALLHAPQTHAAAVWRALDTSARWAIGAIVAAAPSDAAPLAVHDPIAALALAALHADDAALQTAGGAALTARSARIRTIWDDLPPEMQQMLGAIPDLADLSQSPARSARRRVSRR